MVKKETEGRLNLLATAPRSRPQATVEDTSDEEDNAQQPGAVDTEHVIAVNEAANEVDTESRSSMTQRSKPAKATRKRRREETRPVTQANQHVERQSSCESLHCPLGSHPP